jgi:hypothetical protein
MQINYITPILDGFVEVKKMGEENDFFEFWENTFDEVASAEEEGLLADRKSLEAAR